MEELFGWFVVVAIGGFACTMIGVLLSGPSATTVRWKKVPPTPGCHICNGDGVIEVGGKGTVPCPCTEEPYN